MNKRPNLIRAIFVMAVLAITTLQGCLHNQYFDNSTSQCVNCQANCDQCSNSSTNCTACIYGYYLNNNTCVGCPQQCYTCNSSTVCTACNQNYYMKNYTCLSCGKNCMLCTSVSCNTCQTGYDINSNCLSCAKQFFYNGTLNKCDQCPLGCLDCSSKNYCFKCDTKYLMVNNTCKFTGNDQTSTGQTENAQYNTEDSNQSIFFIILGVLVSFVVISCISCSVYYCVRHKQKKIKKQGQLKNLKLVNKVSNTSFRVDKDSVIEPQNQTCIICKKGQAEVASSCGHFFHSKCYQAQERRCPVCPQDFSVAETYFQENKNKQIQLQSEISVKQSNEGEVERKEREQMSMQMDSFQ